MFEEREIVVLLVSVVVALLLVPVRERVSRVPGVHVLFCAVGCWLLAAVATVVEGATGPAMAEALNVVEHLSRVGCTGCLAYWVFRWWGRTPAA